MFKLYYILSMIQLYVCFETLICNVYLLFCNSTYLHSVCKSSHPCGRRNVLLLSAQISGYNVILLYVVRNKLKNYILARSLNNANVDMYAMKLGRFVENGKQNTLTCLARRAYLSVTETNSR